ncbi:hypothetical protein [Campylobacter ureolyticus]|uniref:hypothetical protein n=1 Tax=Campylobacter ureolyticus TaxID=827 RepID=UPI0022B49F05|nr:hypothetical protein [Campylobacter ureolyticus]MCZ6103994.1 hypothetical protein [Campylobacter ureolyticus]
MQKYIDRYFSEEYKELNELLGRFDTAFKVYPIEARHLQKHYPNYKIPRECEHFMVLDFIAYLPKKEFGSVIKAMNLLKKENEDGNLIEYDYFTVREKDKISATFLRKLNQRDVKRAFEKLREAI